MWYDLDIDKLITHLLPVALRKPLLQSLLRSLLSPVKDLHARFISYRNAVNDKLSYNAHVIYLEKFLNDLYGFVNDEIYITDLILHADVYLYNKDENQELLYLYNKAEGGKNTYLHGSPALSLTGSFIVNIPASIDTPDARKTIQKWVDYYKYAGTTYKIESYE